MEEFQQLPWESALPFMVSFLGGIFGFVLLLMKFSAARHLGKLLLGYSFLIILRYSSSFLINEWQVLILIAVFLFLYSSTFFSQKKRWSYAHLIPIAISIALQFTPFLVDRMVATSLIIVYVFLLFRLLHNEATQRGFHWFVNPGSRLVWFRNFIFINVIGFLILILGQMSLYLLSGYVLLLLVFVVYQSLKESEFLTPIPIGNKYQKSTLTPQIKAAVLDRIEEVMEAEFYLRSDASLTNLAKELGVTTHHLSQVLNESLKISFQDLIARYRIRHACHILRDEQYEQVKIESVAAMVGYNSKSSFNTAFKKRTGLTPTEFREAKNVRSYGEERLSERKAPQNEVSYFSLNHVFNLKLTNGMVQNFFKTFGRNVKRNGLFSFLNLLGLTVGFTCSMLIYLFIVDEQSFDQEIPNHDRLFRIAWISDNPQTRTPHPMAQAMVKDIPEVEAAVSISPWYGSGLSKESIRVKNIKRNIFYEEPDFFFADSTFWQVFDLEFVEGDENALEKPFVLVITEPMARKYFGDSSAIGRELELNDMPLAVSAVVKPMPKNAHFHFNAIIPYVTLKQINPDDTWMEWSDFGHFNYIKLKEGVDSEIVETKIPGWVLSYLDWSEPWQDRLKSGEVGFELQPITDIHLTSNLRWELENNGNILYVYILTATLFFLILIASINYVNLTTAKSIERAKEIGIKKTLGAVSRHLSVQFYLESVIFCLIAMAFSVGLSILFLESFNGLTGKGFSAEAILNTKFLISVIIGCIAIGLTAGFYPAMVLSSFRPTEVLKGKLSSNSRGVRLRGALVILQFTISAILIAGSLMIFRQIEFMKNKELGFDQNAVISIDIPESIELGGIDLQKVYQARREIEKIPGVINTSMISNLPGGQFNQHSAFVKGDQENSLNFSEVIVDFGVEEVLGLEIVEGRAFDPSYATDTAELSFMINEIAVQQLNLENPVGTTLVWMGDDTTYDGRIIGVVKDFHYKSLHQDIQPLLITADPYDVEHLLVKVDGNQFSSIIHQIQEIYTPVNKDLPFEYQFLDERLGTLYDQEVKTLNIFSVFAGIALILASLGLLGMAIAILNQRIKEVGIRKILGASSSQVMLMVLGQFVRLVFVALIVGLPLAYILMQRWLNEFSYQAPFGIMPFIWATIILMFVAVISVISAVAKITFSNPVEALRYE
ncbi:ABC transporter permease [Ekhidna sp.]|uniref:ABC transporter permease n=1 Tax=Ekhidna sp. TaxID=2608089 RepID=UPI003B50A60E